jgi:hypothetical protein
MSAIASDDTIRTLDIAQDIQIAASVEITFAAVLEEIGEGRVMPSGEAFPMKLEAWPGGRWYRDLGNRAGHLWGHVQVIKPPILLEICGPMFMSYPAMNFVQYRLKVEGEGTRLAIVHRAFGLIPADHLEGAGAFWTFSLGRLRELAERRGQPTKAR